MNRDSILVSNTLKGDTDSFAMLVQAYQQRLYGFIYKLTLSREDAEEILQEVFIRAYNYLYRYDPRWSLSTWLYRIAINTFKSEYKKKKRISLVSSLDENPEEWHSEANSPETIFEKKEHWLEIVKLINALKKEQKIAFILRYVQGMSYKEMGEILEISPDAAKMKVQRAKHMLGKAVGKLRIEN